MRRRIGLAVGLAILVLFTVAAALLWTAPVNGAAYLLGYGEPVTVTVTDSAVGEPYGKGSEAGRGRDGQGRPVRLYGVRAGETVEATRPVIPVGVGVGPVVYTARSQAVRDLTFGLFGACLLSVLPVAVAVVAVRARRLRRGLVAGDAGEPRGGEHVRSV